MIEKRLSTRLLGYWNGVRKNDDFPDIKRFNVGAIEDIWPNCFRVSVDQRGRVPAYKYEFMGETIAKVYGRDLTGMIVDKSTRQFPGKVIHHKFADIIKECVPMQDEGHFINEKGDLIKYRACILPFGEQRKGITDIVVGLSCRVFR